jgi:coenzyme F420-reducing hydrogenase gamma subunit
VDEAASAGNDSTQDAAACAAVSDVQTIVENADIALSEGRIAVQEQQGWYEIATRALDRIPSSGDGAVSLGVADLQEAVPPVEAWTRTEPAVMKSDAWSHALEALAEPCLAVDSELTIAMFSGG